MPNHVIKSVTLSWGGKPHEIQITNNLCNALESADINLYKMYVDSMRGGTPKMFTLSHFITSLLAAGANIIVDQDEVLRDLTTNAEKSIALIRFVNVFLNGVFPPVEDESLGKSDEAETETKAKKKKKK